MLYFQGILHLLFSNFVRINTKKLKKFVALFVKNLFVLAKGFSTFCGSVICTLHFAAKLVNQKNNLRQMQNEKSPHQQKITSVSSDSITLELKHGKSNFTYDVETKRNKRTVNIALIKGDVNAFLQNTNAQASKRMVYGDFQFAVPKNEMTYCTSVVSLQKKKGLCLNTIVENIHNFTLVVSTVVEDDNQQRFHIHPVLYSVVLALKGNPDATSNTKQPVALDSKYFSLLFCG